MFLSCHCGLAAAVVAEPRFDLGDSPLVNPSWRALHLCHLQMAAEKMQYHQSRVECLLLMIVLLRTPAEIHGPGVIHGSLRLGNLIPMSMHVSWHGSGRRVLMVMVVGHHGMLTGLKVPVAGVHLGVGEVKIMKGPQQALRLSGTELVSNLKTGNSKHVFGLGPQELHLPARGPLLLKSLTKGPWQDLKHLASDDKWLSDPKMALCWLT